MDRRGFKFSPRVAGDVRGRIERPRINTAPSTLAQILDDEDDDVQIDLPDDMDMRRSDAIPYVVVGPRGNAVSVPLRVRDILLQLPITPLVHLRVDTRSRIVRDYRHSDVVADVAEKIRVALSGDPHASGDNIMTFEPLSNYRRCHQGTNATRKTIFAGRFATLSGGYVYLAMYFPMPDDGRAVMFGTGDIAEHLRGVVGTYKFRNHGIPITRVYTLHEPLTMDVDTTIVRMLSIALVMPPLLNTLKVISLNMSDVRNYRMPNASPLV